MSARTVATRLVAGVVAAMVPGIPVAAGKPVSDPYAAMVKRVAAMPGNAAAQALVTRRKLQILNVLWEDTGRYLGSSLGPNISDVTIEVEMNSGGRRRTALMPVIRAPNFSDVTGDVPLDQIRIPVGNQAVGWKAGDPLTYIPLRDLLADPARYLTFANKGKIKGGSLLGKRDRRVLVSAQATFLPVPAEGDATFWPVIFNYQSTKKNPAVLTLLITRQGTSATIIDNARDSLGAENWGQRIFFNAGGQRAPLTAERLSAVQQNGVTSNGEAAATLGDDANLLMLVQIPLKYREAHAAKAATGGLFHYGSSSLAEAPASSNKRSSPDVELAVLGHGPELGPYTELDGLTIERDGRFPIRVTVQFYQATSNGVLSAAIVKSLADQIARVYKNADYVGSLVVPAAEAPARATAWDGTSPPPPDLSWNDFPGLKERVQLFGWAPWVNRPGAARPPLK